MQEILTNNPLLKCYSFEIQSLKAVLTIPDVVCLLIGLFSWFFVCRSLTLHI